MNKWLHQLTFSSSPILHWMASRLCTRAIGHPAPSYSAKFFTSQLLRRPGHQFARYVSSKPSTPRAMLSGLRVGLAAGALVVTGGLTSVIFSDTSVDKEHERNPSQRAPTPMSELVRAYVVYSLCSFPMLVDWSPKILSTLIAIPGVSTLTEAVVRATFFAQFVGAESADGCEQLLHRLRAENKGVLFAYSVEVDENEAAHGSGTKVSPENVTSDLLPPHKIAVAELLNSIEIAAKFEETQSTHAGSGQDRKTWVAIKLTALLPDAKALVNLSRYLVDTRPTPSEPVAFPGAPCSTDLDVLCPWPPRAPPPQLSKGDIASLTELYEDLVKICQLGEEKNIRLIMDAEYSWYTPATDAIVHTLMRRFNKPSTNTSTVTPLIYQTYQAYLHRTPAYLAHSLSDARQHGYALGIKLVRGAYHTHELAAHAARHGQNTPNANADGTAKSPSSLRSLALSPEDQPPVWMTKSETDACYNTCVREILKNIAEELGGSTTDVTGYNAPTQATGILGRYWGSTTIIPRRSIASVPIGVLFGTHNWTSCNIILSDLVERGLARKDESSGLVYIDGRVAGRVAIGQLFGMHDNLTNHLVDITRAPSPFVLKYLPYGGLREVMPYLARRGIENKSVLFEGAAANERSRAWEEIKSRIWN